MKKQLKDYGFNSDMQYYEMIAESFLNGNISQAKEQFKAMPKLHRIAMVRSATLWGWSSGISKNNLSILFDLI